jgi:hypothetical protein
VKRLAGVYPVCLQRLREKYPDGCLSSGIQAARFLQKNAAPAVRTAAASVFMTRSDSFIQRRSHHLRKIDHTWAYTDFSAYSSKLASAQLL